MKYLLNSAVMGAGAYGLYEYAPAGRLELAKFLVDGPVSCVGYQQTIDYIADITGVRVALSRQSVALEPDDEAMVVRLRYRVADPAEKGSLQNEDWEIARLRRLS